MPEPLETPPPTGQPRLDPIARLLAVVDRLRGPDGCPWDREQTVRSMAPSLIEEAYEAVEAIEQGDETATVEELGDVLMVVTLIARIAQDEGRFDIGASAATVADKLVRRHPHVFGDVEVTGSEHVVANWEKIKQGEREEKQTDASALAGVPLALPALQRAHTIGRKAIAAGFKWSDASGAFAKLTEEVGELREAMDAGEAPDPERVAEELGDVLLAAGLLGTYLGVDPERAARDALRRFERRFRDMEGRLGERLRDASLDELVATWKQAKVATAGD